MIYHPIQQKIDEFVKIEIPQERKKVLRPLIAYIQSKVDAKEEINLNYICTHNSRRSQFSQVWSSVAASVFGINANSFSGGVEVTAFNERASLSLKRFGFKISSQGNSNPIYHIHFSDTIAPAVGFSKLYDHSDNPKENFAAVMTCSHADDNCPFIAGTEKRIALNYEDPKAFDGTSAESKMYDQRSTQIASELLFVFGNIQD